MAKHVTDYSQYVTKTEQEILNALTSSISDPEMVQSIYESIIKQRENNAQGYDSIYGPGNDIACGHNGKTVKIDIDIDVLNSVISQAHTRNYDTKLQGFGTNEIINNSDNPTKIISFKVKETEVAYIDAEGKFVGKIGTMTTDDVAQKLEGVITAEEVDRVVSGKADKSALFDEHGKIKEEILPNVIPEGLQEHLDNADIHVTKEKKAEWDAKFNMPETGIAEEHLSEEVKELIDSSTDKLLNQQGHILDTYLNFEKIATKEDVKVVDDKAVANSEAISNLEQNITDMADEKLNKPTDVHTGGFVKVTAENLTSVAEHVSDGDIVISAKEFTGNLAGTSITSIEELLTTIDNLVTGPEVIEDENFGVYQ